MAYDLTGWLKLGWTMIGRRVPNSVPMLDISRLGRRDLADLNLPADVRLLLEARNASDLRRRALP
jgi:hypothetical protein